MSDTYNKTDFLKNAKVGTRVRNSETGHFYIKTKKGWRKDDRAISRLGRIWESDTEEDEYYRHTIGEDGRFFRSDTAKGYTITNDNPIAQQLRDAEQVRVTGRKELAIKKQGDLYEKWDKIFTPIIEKDIARFNEAYYPNNPLTRDIVNAYYAAENKQEFVKNHPVLQHYSHVHLPYDQKGRFKFGPTAGIFSKIISDLDKVERFDKEKIKLQKKYNIVPENNKDNKDDKKNPLGSSFYFIEKYEENNEIDSETQKLINKSKSNLQDLYGVQL